MPCCLFGSNPLSKTMVADWSPHPWEHISVKYYQKQHFLHKKINLKMSPEKWHSFCLNRLNVLKYLWVREMLLGSVLKPSPCLLSSRSMILSKRPKDDDATDGFTKWPFMTTHSWAENPRGTWQLIVIFDSEEPQSGELFEWTLMLHGTQTSPYVGQKVNLDKHSKLAVVKREHENSANFRF